MFTLRKWPTKKASTQNIIFAVSTVNLIFAGFKDKMKQTEKKTDNNIKNISYLFTQPFLA